MAPDMGDIKGKIEGGRDFLGRLMTKIPGFQGYTETAEKYDADRVIRNFMADRIGGLKRTVSSAMKDLSKKAGHDILSDLDSLNTVLERNLKKCQFADYGNKSFSGVSMTLEQQDKLIAFDWNLIFRLDEIAVEFDKLAGIEPAAVAGIIAGISAKITEFEKDLEKRKSVILEVL
jgi:hypothetical protein